jgi:type II secretory pathway predicted ATPase ExeA
MRIAADQQSPKRARGAVSPVSPEAGDAMLAEDLQSPEDAFLDTADPRFCYLDPLRRHASGRLLSGLYGGDGLFLLTGRAGIGKTTLLCHLSEQLKALDGVLPLCSTQVFACRSGTTLADVFAACETRLGLGQSAAAPLKATKKLREFVEGDRSPVLLLDDADLLGDDVLEAVVTLTGLQAADRCLLSAVLTGHPDIGSRVAAITGDGGAQASDRAMELQPMAEPEVARMIRHRLRAAGRPEDTFGADAIAAIVRDSGGVPSAVVRTCRGALQLVGSGSRETMTAEIVLAAVGEEATRVERESPRPAAAPVASPPDRPASEFGASRPQPRPVEPRIAFPPPAEPSTLADIPTQRFPEPSLRRERHASIPEVTLGHHGAPRHESPPTVSREAAWWANTVHSEPPERTAGDHPPVPRRRRGRRAALAIAAVVLFLVLSAAALAIFMAGPRGFGGSPFASSAGGAAGTLPTYDPRSDARAWWRPGGPSESAAPGVVAGDDGDKAGVAAPKPLPSLSSLDTGRQGDPIAAPAEKGAGDKSMSRGADPSPSPIASAAPVTAEPVSRDEAAQQPLPPVKAEPLPEIPAPSVKEGLQAKASATPTTAEAPAKPASPTTRPQPPAAKPSAPQGPQAKLSPATAAKAGTPRNREIESLLAEGDARLDEGDFAAARSAYEQAYDRGSATAAARMAQTFDPRNVAATRKTASPAEAILWYQDAARKGDRRARTELNDLASWLENSAASGNQEARRVLELWREPAPSAAEESAR